MKKRFWRWVHNKLEEAWHWVYYNKLKPLEEPMPTLGNVQYSVYWLDKAGNVLQHGGDQPVQINTPYGSVDWSYPTNPRWGCVRYGSSPEQEHQSDANPQ